MSSGRFVVREANYAIDGTVNSFAADFEQHCEGAEAALFGSVRINSNAPTASPATASPTPPLTPTPRQCPGDCGGDGMVSVDDLVRGVRIALGDMPLSECSAFDRDEDGRVAVGELVAAVAAALGPCG